MYICQRQMWQFIMTLLHHKAMGVVLTHYKIVFMFFKTITTRTAVCFHTCLLSETSCVSSCRIVSTPASWEAERDMMSACSRCMPLGGLRRARSGWWRYWAPIFSFFTGPERLGMALSELALVGFCFTACVDTAIAQISETHFRWRHFYKNSNKKNTFMYNRWNSNEKILQHWFGLADLLRQVRLKKTYKCVTIRMYTLCQSHCFFTAHLLLGVNLKVTITARVAFLYVLITAWGTKGLLSIGKLCAHSVSNANYDFKIIFTYCCVSEALVFVHKASLPMSTEAYLNILISAKVVNFLNKPELYGMMVQTHKCWGENCLITHIQDTLLL